MTTIKDLILKETDGWFGGKKIQWSFPWIPVWNNSNFNWADYVRPRNITSAKEFDAWAFNEKSIGKHYGKWIYDDPIN